MVDERGFGIHATYCSISAKANCHRSGLPVSKASSPPAWLCKVLIPELRGICLPTRDLMLKDEGNIYIYSGDIFSNTGSHSAHHMLYANVSRPIGGIVAKSLWQWQNPVAKACGTSLDEIVRSTLLALMI